MYLFIPGVINVISAGQSYRALCARSCVWCPWKCGAAFFRDAALIIRFGGLNYQRWLLASQRRHSVLGPQEEASGADLPVFALL